MYDYIDLDVSKSPLAKYDFVVRSIVAKEKMDKSLPPGQLDFLTPQCILDICSEADNLDEHAKLAYILRRTALLHEIKHYHDSIATPHGEDITGRFKRIIVALHECVSELANDYAGNIKIPFVEWMGQSKCPEPVTKFRRIYSTRSSIIQEWHTSGLGNVQSWNEQKHFCSTKVFAIRGHTIQAIPVVLLVYRDSKKQMRPTYVRHIVLNGENLFEAGAVSLQFYLIQENFRGIFQELVPFPQYSVEDEITPKYLAPFNFASELLGTLGESAPRLMFALSALSLLGHGKGSFQDIHPGWRFIGALNELARNKKRIQSGYFNLEDVVNEVVRVRNWVPIDETIAWLKRDVYGRYKTAMQSGSFVAFIHKEHFESIMDMLAEIEKNPRILFDVEEYRHNWKYLPLPPVIVIEGENTYGCRDDFSYEAYFINSVLWSMLFKNVIECPRVEYHQYCDRKTSDCGRYPSSYSDGKSCMFENALDWLNIKRGRIKSLH